MSYDRFDENEYEQNYIGYSVTHALRDIEVEDHIYYNIQLTIDGGIDEFVIVHVAYEDACGNTYEFYTNAMNPIETDIYHALDSYYSSLTLEEIFQ